MRTKGNDIKSYFLDIRTKFDADLHQCWTGVLYNNVISLFNEMTPDFNSIMKLLIETIPEQLETIANNYSITETGERVTAVGGETAGIIDSIALRDEILSFHQDIAENVRDAIISDFKHIDDCINAYSTIYQSIPWESDAEAQYTQDIKDKKTRLDDINSKIQNAFSQYMQQASDGLANAERNNTMQ